MFERRYDLGLLLIRLATGTAFFFHGTQKLFGWFGGGGLLPFASYLEQLGLPFPSLSAGLAAVSEVAGALVLLSGRSFAVLLPLLATMGVATVCSARNGFDVQHGGVEYPLVLALLITALILTGPGAYVARRQGP